MGTHENLKFSIIIPTYNEEKEIVETLNSVVNLSYHNREIIVIDDSTDATPQLIRENFGENVEIIRPEERKGRCEARNIGIRHASGDILIVLNADVILPSDFLERLKVHYDSGYDSVTVMADVKNTKSCYARYVDALSQKKERTGVYRARKTKLNGLYWSEGFSVRRSVAIKTNLFPSGYIIPIEAGEDVQFVDELRSNGCKGIIDETLRIEHIAPDNLSEYWSIRKGRGAGTPQIRIFINKWKFQKVFIVISLKLIIRTVFILSFFPLFFYAYRVRRFSAHNDFIELFKLSYCIAIEQIAFSVGEFQSFFKILSKDMK